MPLPKIIKRSNLPNGIEGYFDKSSNSIVISDKLGAKREKEVISHEMEHFKQESLPACPYVDPRESMSKFMDYFSDPKEVSARAAETGEEIPEIWNSVFAIKEHKDITPLTIENISTATIRKFIPSIPIPFGTGKNTDWQFRRIMGTLSPSDPKPIEVNEKTIRIHFKSGGNGIIAESMLREKGINASSVAPSTVDIIIDDKNIESLSKLVREVLLTQGCNLKELK